ncbi:MAG: hypothetical protein OHK0039_16680 [Bacteroidia bacterium]
MLQTEKIHAVRRFSFSYLYKWLSWWRALSDWGVHPRMNPSEAKRTRLTNRIAAIVIVVALPHIFYYLELRAYAAFAVQLATVLAFMSSLVLNARGAYLPARIVLLITASANVLLTSATLGFGNGDHLAFMVIIPGTFMMLDHVRERIPLILLVLLPIGAYLLLETGWFDYLALQTLDAQTQRQTYIGNFLANFILLIGISLYFVALSNREVDDTRSEGQKRMQMALDHSTDGILIADVATRAIIQQNNRAIDLLGSTAPLVGRRLEEVISFVGDERICLTASTNAGTSSESEHELRTLSGRSFWGSIACNRFTYSGEELLVVRIQDISVKKMAEHTLRQAKERAEAATILKANFLSNMSHEFRTPVNGIIGLAQLIYDDTGDEETRQLAGMLRESGRRLHRTVTLVLELSRLESGELDLRPRPADLRHLADDLKATYAPQAHAIGLTFASFTEETPFTACTDTELLREALDHLISNALKFTRKGGIRIGWSLIRTDPTADPWIEISISDTGIGMSESFIRNHLFKKFMQESDGMGREFEGTGLGLAIVKRITELLGGSITVRSTPGQGTSFRLTIPATLHV